MTCPNINHEENDKQHQIDELCARAKYSDKKYGDLFNIIIGDIGCEIKLDNKLEVKDNEGN